MHRTITPLFVAALLLAPLFPAAAAPEEVGESDEFLRDRIGWLREGRVGRDGHFPPNARVKALRQREENRRKGVLSSSAQLISGSTWTPLGPAPSSGYSGRVTSIAVHPTDSNTVYVGAATGGVWKTTNGGTTWTPLTDNQDTLATGVIVIDPANPNTLYVGTGEANFSCDSYYGAGILKSTDGGASWTLLGNTEFANQSISRVVLHPSNSSVLWASTTSGTGGFVCGNRAPTAGIYTSVDGGLTWTRKSDGHATDLLIDPANANTLYAAFDSVGVRKSTDGGNTWSNLGGGLPTANIGRVDLAFKASTSTVYATYENGSNGGYLGAWKSTDGGTSWTALGGSPANLCNGYCWYFIGMDVAPNGDLWMWGYKVYRSTNDGSSWSEVGSSMHVDHHAVAFAPNGNLWVGNDGGVYKSTNSGSTWTAMNAGLQIMQFYPGASLHPTDANYMLGGAQDNGTNRRSGSTWTQIYGGDGCWTAIHPTSPSTIYVSYQYLMIRKSTNGGSSFTSATSGLTDANNSTNAPFIGAFLLCPANPSIMIAGSNNIWRSTNGASSWSSNSPDPLVPGGSGKTAQFNALAFAPSDSACNTYFVGSKGGKLYRTAVGGGTSTANWSDITGTLPARGIQDIAVHPTNANIVYVTLTGWGGGHVFKTTNALASTPTWTDVSASLPDAPVNAVLLDPTDSNLVYAGSDVGIFRSTDAGATWSIFMNGMPNAPVFDLVANSATNSVVAFTHGRGAWKLSP